MCVGMSVRFVYTISSFSLDKISFPSSDTLAAEDIRTQFFKCYFGAHRLQGPTDGANGLEVRSGGGNVLEIHCLHLTHHTHTRLETLQVTVPSLHLQHTHTITHTLLISRVRLTSNSRTKKCTSF